MYLRGDRIRICGSVNYEIESDADGARVSAELARLLRGCRERRQAEGDGWIHAAYPAHWRTKGHRLLLLVFSVAFRNVCGSGGWWWWGHGVFLVELLEFKLRLLRLELRLLCLEHESLGNLTLILYRDSAARR